MWNVHTEPKRPLQVPQKHLLPFHIRRFTRAQQRAATLTRRREAGAEPVRVFGVRGFFVFVGHEGKREDLVSEFGGEDAEEGGLELVVCGKGDWGWGGHGGGRWEMEDL